MQSPGCTCPRLRDILTLERWGLRFSGDLIWALSHRHATHFIVDVLQISSWLLAVMKDPERSDTSLLLLSLSHFLSCIKIWTQLWEACKRHRPPYAWWWSKALWLLLSVSGEGDFSYQIPLWNRELSPWIIRAFLQANCHSQLQQKNHKGGQTLATENNLCPPTSANHQWHWRKRKPWRHLLDSWNQHLEESSGWDSCRIKYCNVLDSWEYFAKREHRLWHHVVLCRCWSESCWYYRQRSQAWGHKPLCYEFSGVGWGCHLGPVFEGWLWLSVSHLWSKQHKQFEIQIEASKL
jgi:hypothetical protein